MTDYGDAVIDVRLNTAQADRQLKDLLGELQKAVRAFESQGVDIKVDTSRATSNLRALVDQAQASARAIEGVNADIKVDTSRSTAKIERLEQEYRSTARKVEQNEIDVKVDTSKAEANVRSLDRTLRRVVGIVAGAQLVSGLTRLSGGIAGFAIEAVGQIDNLRVGLQGLNEELDGTSPVSDQFVEDLKGIASTSTIAFETLASSAQKFRATFGSGFDNTGLVQTLGDVNALLGGSTNTFDRASLALTQIAAKGVQLEEINQLREALPGFDALGAIAEARGISIAETFKLIEQRGVTGAEGIEILVAAMETFPGAAGAMERQAQTLTGSIQNLQTVFSLAASTAFGPFGFAVAGAVGILREATVEGGAVAEVFEGVNDAFTRVVQGGLTQIVPTIVSLGEAFIILVEGAEPLITEFLPKLAELAPAGAEALVSVLDVVLTLATATLPLAEVALPLLTDGMEALTFTAEALGPLLPPIVVSLIALKAASQIGSLSALASNLGLLLQKPSGPGATRLDTVNRQLGDLSPKATAASGALGAAAGAFGGFSIATSEGADKISGFVSAAGGIALGFATGGPIGGALAVAGTAVGFFAGTLSEAAEEAKELEANLADLAVILRNEFSASALAEIKFEDVFDLDAAKEKLSELVDPELFERANSAGISLAPLIDIQLDTDSTAQEISATIEEIEAQLLASGFSDSEKFNQFTAGVFGAPDEGEAQQLIVDLINVKNALLDVQEAAFTEEILQPIQFARSAGNFRDADQAARDYIATLEDGLGSISTEDTERLFGLPPGALQNMQVATNLMSRLTDEIELTKTETNLLGTSFTLAQIEAAAITTEANRIEREFGGVSDRLEAIGLIAPSDFLSTLDEDTIDAVKEGLGELQELINGFASEIGSALVPDLSGTIDQVGERLQTENDLLVEQIEKDNAILAEATKEVYDERREGAQDAFTAEQEQARAAYDEQRSIAQAAYDDQKFAAKEAYDALEDQGERFKFPDFEYPEFEAGEFEFPDFEDMEFPELPEPEPITIRAIIDQFEVNQAEAQGVTDQVQQLVDGGFDNVAYNIGDLLVSDPEQAELFLRELFPEGVLAEEVAGEFDDALGANSAAQAKIIGEWTVIANTIAPILGQAIAQELAAVLGVEYNVRALLGLDLAEARRALAGTPFSIKPTVEISADDLRNLAVTNITGVADILGVQVKDVYSEISQRTDIFGNLIIDKTQFDELSNEELSILLDVDPSEVEAYLDDPKNVETRLEVDTEALAALAEADPVKVQALLGLNRRELDELLANPETIPSTLGLDTTAFRNLVESDPETIATLLGVTTDELDVIVDATYELNAEIGEVDPTPILTETNKVRKTKVQLEAEERISGLPSVVYIPAVLQYARVQDSSFDQIRARIEVANGGIINGAGVQTFKHGGFSENHVAHIANPQVPFRVWAEPETGGEAYIPLSPMKRARSEEILGVVAHKFGKELVNQGAGGDFNAAANSSMIARMDTMLQQMRVLAAAVAQMPPITVNAAGGDPENAASKIYWGHRKRLSKAGV